MICNVLNTLPLYLYRFDQYKCHTFYTPDVLILSILYFVLVNKFEKSFQGNF